jgi:hypothetical protein
VSEVKCVTEESRDITDDVLCASVCLRKVDDSSSLGFEAQEVFLRLQEDVGSLEVITFGGDLISVVHDIHCLRYELRKLQSSTCVKSLSERIVENCSINIISLNNLDEIRKQGGGQSVKHQRLKKMLRRAIVISICL